MSTIGIVVFVLGFVTVVLLTSLVIMNRNESVISNMKSKEEIAKNAQHEEEKENHVKKVNYIAKENNNKKNKNQISKPSKNITKEKITKTDKNTNKQIEIEKIEDMTK